MFDRVVLFIMGPTCVGKSKISIELSKTVSLNVINMDSSSVYRYMDIGTSKPNKKELKALKHYLIDIKDPIERYSVGDFCIDSLSILNISFLDNKIPCFVGGTMMYSWYFQSGFFSCFYLDFDIKDSFFSICNFYGLDYVYNRLMCLNFNLYDFLTLCNFYLITDIMCLYKFFNIKSKNAINLNYNIANIKIVNIGIFPREKFCFYDRIEDRFNFMLDMGFINEIDVLYNNWNLSVDMSSIKSIGYKHAWNYLDNKLSFFEFRSKSVMDTKFLYKRQVTWLKRWDNKIHCFFDDDSSIVYKIKSLCCGN